MTKVICNVNRVYDALERINDNNDENDDAACAEDDHGNLDISGPLSAFAIFRTEIKLTSSCHRDIFPLWMDKKIHRL